MLVQLRVNSNAHRMSAHFWAQIANQWAARGHSGEAARKRNRAAREAALADEIDMAPVVIVDGKVMAESDICHDLQMKSINIILT